MYTYIVHYEKTLKTILQGYKCPAQNFSGKNRKTTLEKSSWNLTNLHGTLHLAHKNLLKTDLYKVTLQT